jgi:6-phosphogluconolactonase
MLIEVLETPEAVAKRAADIIAEDIVRKVAERGTYILAVSGGKTPWLMLQDLSKEDLPWGKLHILQVDERIAPAGDPDRNLTHILSSLATAPIPAENIHAMPVEASDPETAAQSYSKTLVELAGSPPVLDMAHLGLGSDGHTASLVPGDPVLHVSNKDVAVTGVYQGRQRLTLTYPVLNHARRILWLTTGAEKLQMLELLRKGDTSIPAGRIAHDHALVLADRAAVPGK